MSTSNLKKSNVGLYVGSFNPMTVGHENILYYAAQSGLFEKILLCRGQNPNKHNKEYQKFSDIRDIVRSKEEEYKTTHFEAIEYKGLTTSFVDKVFREYSNHNFVIIRGLRNVNDYENEKYYLQTLRQIGVPEMIKCVYFMCDPKFSNVSSSMVGN